MSFSLINIDMIYFIFIDQNSGTFTVDGNESDQMKSAFLAQVKFFKELNLLLGATKRPRHFRFVWAYNHPNQFQRDIDYYQDLVTTKTRLGSFHNMQHNETLDDVVKGYPAPTKLYLIGGNVTGCMVNTNLPFNYNTLSTGAVKPELVLDLCYDYIIPYTSDKELYSILATYCNKNNISFTNSSYIKLELLG
jgi:hypothetical protein